MPCALQDGAIARKKISDVFPKPKHIGVSLLVWYLFCARVKLRLHATINRVRFVFWRIKMSAGAIIHCRFVKKKFQMWPAYACLLNDIRQNTNRTRLIAVCKRSFKLTGF